MTCAVHMCMARGRCARGRRAGRHISRLPTARLRVRQVRRAGRAPRAAPQPGLPELFRGLASPSAAAAGRPSSSTRGERPRGRGAPMLPWRDGAWPIVAGKPLRVGAPSTEHRSTRRPRVVRPELRGPHCFNFANEQPSELLCARTRGRPGSRPRPGSAISS